MHQPFEEDRPHRSPHRAGGDFRYREFYCKGWGVDPDLYRERLEMLRFEQERRVMFNPNDEIDEPLFYTRTHHVVDFTCQCKSCVRKTTINMQDASFLRSIGIVWRVPVAKEEVKAAD